MLRMNRLLIFTVLAVLAFTVIRQPTPALNRVIQLRQSSSASYARVSFDFDLSLAKEVKAEMIPASLDGKPSDIWPEHPGFYLVDYPRPRTLPASDPQIRVFSVQKFREAFDVASKEFVKTVVSRPKLRSWTIDFEEEVRVLKTLLASKPAPASLGRFLAKTRGKKGCSAAMPFLPMWEACQALVAHVTYVNFQKGQGVFFLTQWDTETSQITNDGLVYAFQGITDDGKYYVYAEFSVSTPVLPNGDEPSVKEWNEKNYLLSHQSRQYLAYQRPVVAELEALRGDKFQPKLKLLEQLIESLKVEMK
jgi:hypothetical protein